MRRKTGGVYHAFADTERAKRYEFTPVDTCVCMYANISELTATTLRKWKKSKDLKTQ